MRCPRSYSGAVNNHIPKEPLWRHIVGAVLRRERLAQGRTLKDVADVARISMPYLSELERGRKEASSEVLAAAAHALELGLADLLALAQSDLARLARTRSATGRVAAAVSDGSAVSEVSVRRARPTGAPRPSARQARLSLAA
ncbi:helix-turn-helix domain-containing protein [Streptomyces sp. NPDC000229]|uniref:helix-turn-helix domain-containing protein n=1 Tax=Streptomyces sp. NPDC000229 TaxID=3154247 RepID=UPI00332DDFBF